MNKRFRLRKNRDFQRIYRRGKRYPGTHMALLLMQKHGLGLRVGFSVSKKVGNSVVRSRVKRVMREAFRPEIPFLRQNFDYVWVARSSMAREGTSAVAEEMKALLKRAGAQAHAAS